MCHHCVEDVLHALRECPRVTALWRKLVPVDRRNHFFGSNWEEWIEGNLKFRGRGEEESR